jgi:hypothetical protein
MRRWRCASRGATCRIQFSHTAPPTHAFHPRMRPWREIFAPVSAGVPGDGNPPACLARCGSFLTRHSVATQGLGTSVASNSHTRQRSLLAPLWIMPLRCGTVCVRACVCSVRATGRERSGASRTFARCAHLLVGVRGVARYVCACSGVVRCVRVCAARRCSTPSNGALLDCSDRRALWICWDRACVHSFHRPSCPCSTWFVVDVVTPDFFPPLIPSSTRSVLLAPLMVFIGGSVMVGTVTKAAVRALERVTAPNTRLNLATALAITNVLLNVEKEVCVYVLSFFVFRLRVQHLSPTHIASPAEGGKDCSDKWRVGGTALIIMPLGYRADGRLCIRFAPCHAHARISLCTGTPCWSWLCHLRCECVLLFLRVSFACVVTRTSAPAERRVRKTARVSMPFGYVADGRY